MIKVGDEVYVKILNKYNFRGAVIEIENNVATINVPVYYGKDSIVVYKDIAFLDKVPETLKELENLKIKRRG